MKRRPAGTDLQRRPGGERDNNFYNVKESRVDS